MPTEPQPRESASENSWSSLLQTVPEDANFLPADETLLPLALLLLAPLWTEVLVAGRRGLSGKENAGDAATVRVFLEEDLVPTIYVGHC